MSHPPRRGRGRKLPRLQGKEPSGPQNPLASRRLFGRFERPKSLSDLDHGIGLDRGQRRDVQRRLTGLGFDVKATGKFDDATRSVIKRWQAARGYPVTGYLNTLEHKALLGEIVSTRVASIDDGNGGDDDSVGRHYSRRGGGSRNYRGGGGGPGALFGHMMGGMFR